MKKYEITESEIFFILLKNGPLSKDSLLVFLVEKKFKSSKFCEKVVEFCRCVKPFLSEGLKSLLLDNKIKINQNKKYEIVGEI